MGRIETVSLPKFVHIAEVDLVLPWRAKQMQFLALLPALDRFAIVD